MKTNDPRFEIIRRCRDGGASGEERVQLEGWLREDEGFRIAYLRYQNVDLALETVGMDETSAPRSETRAVKWKVWPTPAAAAVFAMLGLLAGLVWQSPETTPDFVATLTLADECVWENDVPLLEGQRVAVGPLRLRSGTAMLRFDAGASVLMQGAVDLELRSRSRAVLRDGEVMVRAGEEAAGFLLETPASQVTDLGTEFAVKVEPSGATEVHVMEGLVSYRKPGSGGGSVSPGEALLTAGHAVRYDAPAQESPREVTLLQGRFDEALNATVAARKEVALLAHEPFDYAAEMLPLAEAAGGTGWQGGWQPAGTWPHPSDPLRPLRFVSSPAIQEGRLLDASDAFPQISRKLAAPIRMDRDGIYYFSARLRWEPGTSPVQVMRQVRVILRSSTDPKNARYVLNLPTCLLPQIQRHDLEVFTSREKVEAGDLQRWVLKIVARERGNDELHLRVFRENESPGLLEPDQWHLNLTSERCDGVLDQIVLDTYLAPDPAAFGDIRLGTSWRSVTR